MDEQDEKLRGGFHYENSLIYYRKELLTEKKLLKNASNSITVALTELLGAVRQTKQVDICSGSTEPPHNDEINNIMKRGCH